MEAAFTPTQLPRKNWKTMKMANEVKILWRLVAVGNGWLWLTPCKRMKLRRSEWAQLGDCTKEGMSLVEGRLWSKLWSYYNRPSPTLTTLFGSVSKLRSQASLHGVNHNMPFPTAPKSLFSTFSALSIIRVHIKRLIHNDLGGREVSRPYHSPATLAKPNFRKTSPKSTKICDFGEVLRKLGLASVAGLW